MSKNIRNTSRKNLFEDLSNHLKLIFRLMADSRVPVPLKILPAGALIYLIVFPDLAPGPVDDAVVIWLGLQFFVELCPREVVTEHQKRIEGTIPASSHAGSEEVIDGESRDV